ncbi:DNA-directed RNA polymerase III subunit RPC8-like isoform X1 [Leptotrombidium deliense]|uniref:DNA-directed RNA polymerase III subunit RPC8 n=1 Tax=Leptotrombidium deliense TaxID=299467 RepID=A0A443SNK6_9ACAR|nr:DNA-directed RNA polymerase III subunit RPC8-like isoform X1 [Leptotrombidium deliense]
MFVLVELKDKVCIAPSMFHLPVEEAITEVLNAKLANRILINVGLCVTLFDIIKIHESFVLKGEGSSYTLVHFRFIVFRPFIGEVIVGKLKSCSVDGIYVSLGFFDGILIPRECLQEPSRFDETEQLWVWEYETEDGKHDLFMDKEEQIRFKVKEEIFTDTSPTAPSTSTANLSAEDSPKKIPYLIKGTIAESGLGLISWWK